jgi:hypothetical protein
MRYLLLLTLALLTTRGYCADPITLALPKDAKFINGTGQLPIIQAEFAAPGVTSQGYIEVAESAGPHVYFIGLNACESALTIRNSYKTAYNTPLARITYAVRNKELGLTCQAEETVVQPWQFYVSDPMPLTVKAGEMLYLRTFIPLTAKTRIGCGIISGSNPRPDKRWPYGNVVGAEDRTLDPDLEAAFKPTSDLLPVPFLLAGDGVRTDAPFVVVIGDSLTFQLSRDLDNGWFSRSFHTLPHCNLAIGGDALSNVLDANGQLRDRLNQVRFAILRHATDMINFYGHNDLGNGCPLDTMLNLERKLCARPELAKARKWRATLSPFTHNAKGVDVKNLTEADQTPDKYSPVIVQFNQELRANYPQYGYTGLLDFGAAMATGPDSMFWKPGLAADGTHFERVAGFKAVWPEIEKVLPIMRSAPGAGK